MQSPGVSLFLCIMPGFSSCSFPSVFLPCRYADLSCTITSSFSWEMSRRQVDVIRQKLETSEDAQEVCERRGKASSEISTERAGEEKTEKKHLTLLLVVLLLLVPLQESPWKWSRCHRSSLVLRVLQTKQDMYEKLSDVCLGHRQIFVLKTRCAESPIYYGVQAPFPVPLLTQHRHPNIDVRICSTINGSGVDGWPHVGFFCRPYGGGLRASSFVHEKPVVCRSGEHYVPLSTRAKPSNSTPLGPPFLPANAFDVAEKLLPPCLAAPLPRSLFLQPPCLPRAAEGRAADTPGS